MKIVLTSYAHLWHRLWSIRLLILTTAYTLAAGAWAVIPGDWKPDLSETARAILAGVGVLLPVISGLAVLIRQEGITESPPSVPPSVTAPKESAP